jgi:hypothetical protein
MGTNGSPLKHPTTCRLKKPDGSPCGHTILDHPLNVQIIGQVDQRLMTFMGALMRHLEKKHPEAWNQAHALSQHFMGWLVLQQYETEDPAILQSLMAFAITLRGMVRVIPISDAEIEGAVAALGFTMDDPQREPVLGLAKNVRAYYEGTLQKPPSPEAEKPLITP